MLTRIGDAGPLIAATDPHNQVIRAGPKKIVTLRLELESAKMDLSQAISNLLLLEPGHILNDDLSGIEPPPAITLEDIRCESCRANDLEAVLVQKERLLKDYLTQSVPTEASGPLKMVRLRLDAASSRRTALEARLSETHLRKNYSQLLPSGQTAEGDASPAHFVAAIRQIGNEINPARFEKRALEYVVD